MTKVMVFNFKTMQFEQASEEEGNDFLSLISAMNSECAAEQSVQSDGARCACKLPGFDVDKPAICPTCHKPHRS